MGWGEHCHQWGRLTVPGVTFPIRWYICWQFTALRDPPLGKHGEHALKVLEEILLLCPEGRGRKPGRERLLAAETQCSLSSCAPHPKPRGPPIRKPQTQRKDSNNRQRGTSPLHFNL